MSRNVELGQVLLLSMNLPKRLRQYDLNDASYRVYSLVRGISRKGEQNRVGVMFFGKFPPRGFNEKPGARFLLPSDSQPGMSPPLMPRPGRDTARVLVHAERAVDRAAGRSPPGRPRPPESLRRRPPLPIAGSTSS